MTEAEKALLEAAVKHSPERVDGAGVTGIQAWSGQIPAVDRKLIEARDAVRRERMTPGLIEEAKQAWLATYQARIRSDRLVALLEENGVKVSGPSGLISASWYEEAKAAYGS